MARNKLSKRRKLAAILSAVLVVALAVTGTMAWTQLDGEETNEWGDTVTPGGNGHDDFDGNEDKDVYYENYGSAPLFVRIRLDEYMELGESTNAKSLVKGAKRSDKTTWTPHVPAAQGTPEVCAPGNLETAGVDFHDFWTWKMGSAFGERYYWPTLPTDTDAGKVQKDQFYKAPGNVDGRQLKAIPEATVVTMAKWVADGMPIGNYWVVDTDGWAYWAAPLVPKSATGLLLNEVKLTNKPDQSYYYAINVRYNASDKTDIGVLKNTATDAGKVLLDKISGTKSLDELLDAAIAAANAELAKGPDGYTPASVAALEAARDAAVGVKNNPNSTDPQKQTAIDNIFSNIPLISNELNAALDAAIARANAELAKETAAPGTYTPASVAALETARDAAVGVKNNPASTDPQKQTAISNIDSKIPLSQVPSTLLETKTSPGPLGFESFVDTENPEYSNTTQAGYEGGVEAYHLRFATIALEDILKNASDISGTTVAAVDPALASVVKIMNNMWSNGWGDSKRSIVCEFTDFTAAGLASLDNGITTVSYSPENAPIITTAVRLTNGSLSATVTVSFHYTHSLFL